MLTFGQDLYYLTARDQSTLLVDSYFRTATGTIAAAALFGSVSLQIPTDRCLFIQRLNIDGAATALSNYTALFVEVTSTTGVKYRILTIDGSGAMLGDNASASSVGVAFATARSLSLLIPPNTSSINLTMSRSNSTNPATISISVCGYLVPPGGIGRLA